MSNMTMLIVDDNEENLYQLQILLGGNGYQVVTAGNGAEALTKARQTPPDLIISDILMPVMDGFALCREWKKDERLRPIPFVFYTATYTDERDREFALGLGAERFIVKPEDPEVFIRIIREVIQQVQRPPSSPAKATAGGASGPNRLPIEAPQEEETGYLKQYNEALIRKLEAKMMQLEQANGELERDITERKRADEALRTSEQQFRAMFDMAAIGIAQADTRTGQWLRVNQKMCIITGYSTAELLRMRILEITHPEDRQKDEEAFQRVVRGEAPDYRLEKRYVRKDGTVAWVNVNMTVIRDADGEPTRTIATIEDITERRQVEESHARLATAVEQAAETIMITDAKGTILYANPAFERTTGYTCQEALGQNSRLLKSGKHDAEFYQRMWAVLTAGQVWSGHIINKRKDGTLYEEDATISPVINPAGRIVNYVAVKRDVTHEMALEAQYRQAQKMDAIGQLAGGVAHDFNNILAVFMMHLGLLCQRPDLDAEMREDLKELESGVRRAASLTRQLLMFSRRSVMQAKPLDLNEVVENLLKMLRRLIGEQIRLQFHAGPALPRTQADAGMLEQVVMNLTINARDAMPKGGCLTLSTSVIEFNAAQAALNADRRPGRFVCLSVADTGTGMDEVTLKRLFEPFFTTKEVGKGTGLGLATVYGIAKQHQGWVEVESVLGQGSKFHVFLPASSEAVVEAVPGSCAKPICRGSETILLVEDEADVRTTVASFLRHYGYRVLDASNGPEALALWEKHRTEIDLLFTDMIMPEGLTGLDLAAQLRKEKPELKVVLSSGYSAELASSGSLAAHRVTYLPKPAEPGLLAAAVRNCLDQPPA